MYKCICIIAVSKHHHNNNYNLYFHYFPSSIISETKMSTVLTSVLDIGTCVSKSGFSAEEAPRSVTHSCVGVPRHRNTRAKLLKHPTDIMAGDDAYHNYGLLNISKPVVRGKIVDFDSWESLVFDILYRRLSIQPDATPMLFLEPPDQLRHTREKMTEIMVESFNVPMIGILNTSTATIYSTGRTTGVAVDSGAGVTRINVVEDGYCVENAMRSSFIAGDALTDELFYRLRRRGYPLSTRKDWQLVETLKETLCRVSLDVDAECRQMQEKGPTVSYDLPDNERLFLFEDEFMLAECLFDPSKMLPRREDSRRSVGDMSCMNPSTTLKEEGEQAEVNTDYWRPTSPTGYTLTNPSCICPLKGWGDLIEDVIQLSPEVLRETLYENIVLGGGTSMLTDLEKGLQRELMLRAANKKTVMGDPRVVKCVAFEERAHAAWIGASIWSASPVFLSTTLSKADYHEYGPSSIHLRRY